MILLTTDHISFAQLSAGEHLGRVCLWTFTDSTSADVSGHPSPSFSSEYEPRTGIGGLDSTSQLLEKLPNSLPQLPLSHMPFPGSECSLTLIPSAFPVLTLFTSSGTADIRVGAKQY